MLWLQDLHFTFYVAVLVSLHTSAFFLHSNRLAHLYWSHLALVNLPFLLYKSLGISLSPSAIFLSTPSMCLVPVLSLWFFWLKPLGFVGMFCADTLVWLLSAGVKTHTESASFLMFLSPKFLPTNPTYRAPEHSFLRVFKHGLELVSHQHDTSEMPMGISPNIHLDSRMNWLNFEGQIFNRTKKKVTPYFFQNVNYAVKS